MNIIEQLKAAHAAATPGAWDYTIQANNLPALLEAVEVLEAIQARINGEFDNPALERMGPLSADMREDIRQWCDAALAKLKGEA